MERTATAIQIEKYEKFRGIAHGNIEEAISSLRLIFAQRREFADYALRNPDDPNIGEMMEMFNTEIRKALFL